MFLVPYSTYFYDTGIYWPKATQEMKELIWLTGCNPSLRESRVGAQGKDYEHAEGN